LKRELGVIIEEAKRKRDNPRAVAIESLFGMMFDVHRMRRWRIGEPEQLAGFTRADVHGFYRAFYRGPNIVLSVVGDVNTAEAIELVEEHYGALAGPPVARDRGAQEPARREFRYRGLPGDVTNAYVEWGWQTPPLLHEDTPALDVLAMVLGQGRASRLYRHVRDGGLAHAVDAGNYTPEDLGVFNVSLETTPALTLPALRASVGVLRQAADAVEDEELARVRTITRARLLRRMETVEGQANLLADWQALGSWEMAIPHYRQMLETDAAKLRDVASRYLEPAHASLLIHAPRDAELPADAGEMKALLSDHTAELSASKPAGRGPSPQAAAPARVKADFTGEEDGVRFYRTAQGAHVVVLPRPGTGLVSMA